MPFCRNWRNGINDIRKNCIFAVFGSSIHGSRVDGRDKFISVEIPKFKLVVVTGPSSSGKSTLAMDTLQRECKRQYMESISCPEQTRARKKDRRHCGILAVVPL
ncbi:hypothetical protein E2R60_27355 [Paenibacillus dendritiformis]|nr:hypothetical protein E2R60_27355 [Paenibacillus dendritiformis]